MTDKRHSQVNGFKELRLCASASLRENLTCCLDRWISEIKEVSRRDAEKE